MQSAIANELSWSIVGKHDVIHKTRSTLRSARSSEEDRDTATIINMSVKFREVWSRDVFELSERTDRQTDRPTYSHAHRITSHRWRRRSSKALRSRRRLIRVSSAVDSRAQESRLCQQRCWVRRSVWRRCGTLCRQHMQRDTDRHAHRNTSNKAIADYTSPALCTPATPFPPTGDAAYRQHAEGGPSRGHRQHAQKSVKIARVVLEMCSRRQTDRQTYRLITILRTKRSRQEFAECWVKAKFHYAILLANQLASWYASWSAWDLLANC